MGDDALAVFAAHRQLDLAAHEAGGLLLGRLLLGGDDIVVDEAVGPSPQDTRTRTTFVRARAPAQVVIDERWKHSDGTRVYLGEWHTHPEDDPTPSSVDIFNWRRIFISDRFETDFLLFAIVGRRATRWWEAWRVPRGVAVEPLRAADQE